jgi:hypothetical protein
MDIEGGELQALKGMERTLASSPSMVQVIDEQEMRLKTVTSEIETAKYVNLFCKPGDLYARRESDVSNR